MNIILIILLALFIFNPYAIGLLIFGYIIAPIIIFFDFLFHLPDFIKKLFS